MTAQLGNVDCRAVLLLVERYVDCRRTHFLLRHHMLPVHQNAREKPNVPNLILPCLPFWLKVWPNTYKHMLSKSPLIHRFLFIGKDDAKMGPFRFVILFLGGIIAYFGSKAVELEGAGALAVLVMAFVAGIGW